MKIVTTEDQYILEGFKALYLDKLLLYFLECFFFTLLNFYVDFYIIETIKIL